MAAILKLRRGSTTPTSLEQSELFYNSTLATIQVGKSSATNDNITLVKISNSSVEMNTGSLNLTADVTASSVVLTGDITASNLTLSGNATIAGNITFGGELITLGDANTDNIVISGELSSSLIPNNDNAFDLGSTDKKYRNVNAYNLNGSVTDIKLLNFTASQEAKDSTLATYTGSINDKFTTLASVTGSTTASIIELFGTASNHANKFTTLGTYTGSIDDKFTTLASTTGSITASLIELFGTASNHDDRIVYLSSSFSQSVDDRLDQLEVNSGSVNNSITLLNSFSSSQETKDSTLATYTGSIDNKFTTLGTYTGSVDLDLTSIHSFTSSQETKDSTLATYTASVDSDITELYATASNHEIRVDGIQDYTSSLRTAIGVNGSNVTINGDLSVLGTTTQINSTQVNIGDNILELNYGGAITKGGIFVSDATGTLTSGSLLWNSVTDRWIAGPSSSESPILLAGGDNVVSGSAQVVESLKSTFLEIDGDNVVSGSSQVNLTQTTNYTSGIKDRLNIETVISGSSQVILSESADYVSAIKHRLNIESVLSSSIQVDVYNTTNFTTYSASIDNKLIQLINDSASQDGRLDNLELFTSSQETKNSTLGTYTGSNDTKWDVLGSVTESLINATSSYETKGRDIVSGSSQLTSSYDLRYANSQSFHNLVGEWNYGTQGSIRDSAFYSVTSSAQLDTGSITSASLNDTFIFTAGATKEYVNWRTEAILNAIGAADITAVNAGSGLIGGGVTGDVTLTLDTGSTHFNNGIKTKLNTEGVISGSSQIINILGPLNSFSASEETKNSTLGTYTGSVDTNLNTLNSFSSSIDTTIKTKLNLDGVVSGSSQIVSILSPLNTFSASQETKNSTLGTYTGSVDTTLTNLNSFSSSINTTIKTKLDVEGVLSGSLQIVSILNPLNTFSASQETKDSTLATYTASVDNSLSGLNAVSHSHSNKANLDTINQDLATTSDVTFGSFHTTGTGSIGTNLTIYGNLTVFGTESIINSENLAVTDNMIYLNANSEITNPDLGIAGNYNDGTYAHTGIFSDASDSQTWKVFKGYTLEPSGSIDTSHASFSLADFKAGNITGTSLGVGMDASATAGRIDATNDIVAYSSSDRRFKENITPIENALDKINQIGGYEFDWKEENKIEHGYEGHDLGVIAQEIEAIAPELVQTRENGYKAVKYDKLVSVLIQAVKELSAKVSELENK